MPVRWTWQRSGCSQAPRGPASPRLMKRGDSLAIRSHLPADYQDALDFRDDGASLQRNRFGGAPVAA